MLPVLLVLFLLVAPTAGCTDGGPPTRKLAEGDVKKSAPGQGNEVPEVGTVVLRSMPLDVTRGHLRAMTEKDPVRVVIGSFGRGDDPNDVELHLTLESAADCTVVGVRGVAYGFDARGKPASVNVGGVHFLAFAKSGLSLPSGKRTDVAVPVRDVPRASIALAHVDAITCEDGKARKVR